MQETADFHGFDRAWSGVAQCGGSFGMPAHRSARRRGGFGSCPRIIAFTLALCDTCLWAGTVVSRCRAPPHWFLDKNGL